MLEYLYWLLSLAIVWQIINEKSSKGGRAHGHSFYKMSGIINMIFGFGGMVAVNELLRDRGIIPDLYVYIALFGFLLIMLYGMYCIIKMMITMN